MSLISNNRLYHVTVNTWGRKSQTLMYQLFFCANEYNLSFLESSTRLVNQDMTEPIVDRDIRFFKACDSHAFFNIQSHHDLLPFAINASACIGVISK